MTTAAIILAAGQGTRMNSDLPKVLHAIDGRPMVAYVVDSVRAAGVGRVVVVIGHQADRVREALAGADVGFALQEQQLGTGHAVMQCEDALEDFDGTVVVLNGDVPGLTPETLRRFLGFHAESGASATVLTARMQDPSGYGRIVRGDDDSLRRIVEHKDATDEERRIDEINSGLFCFDARALFRALGSLKTDNVQNEYYLTDVVEVLNDEGNRTAAWCVDDNREVAGVNTVEELEAVRRFMRGEDR